tara:strand:+ start:1393 stop:1884 length:492 start_codon:yes stop_codon:yes gene_type:complete
LPERKWSKHAWYNYGRDDYHSKPVKELEIIYSTGYQFKLLGECLGTALHNYQKKYSTEREEVGPGWIRHISQVRFNRYKVGTKMRLHYDHIQSLFDGKLKGIPIISIVGLLNDNYEGGTFICRKKEVKLRRGDILLFPSNFIYPHEVKEVTKGIRHSFVSWAF